MNWKLSRGIIVILAGTVFVSETLALTISLPAVKDNTLFRYDPNDPGTPFNSNGSGDFFSAGRTFSRDEIRRGLIQFDLSSVPDGMQLVPGSVNLQLRVVGIPRRDTTPRPFWVVGLYELSGQWGEGASVANIGVSGSGSGAPAQSGDATWFHTNYDPNIHNETTFTSGEPGFWNEQGALAMSSIPDSAALFGPEAGISGSTEDFVNFASTRMEQDVLSWMIDPGSNFGWIIIGDEGVDDDDDEMSSKRDFATREHANLDFRPVLTFDVIDSPPGDYNVDGLVDAGDYVRWRDTLGAEGIGLFADGNLDEMVDEADYDHWVNNFGEVASGTGSTTVPEPSAIVLCFLAVLGIVSVQSAARR